MKPYTNDFQAQEMTQKVPYPPAGAYIGRILNVRLEDGRNGDQVITLQVDIAEGEYAGHYRKMYDHDKAAGFEGVRFKGSYRMTAPGKENPYFDSRDRGFRSDIWAIEQSNPNYRWNWDEMSLKGLMVGLVVRDAEYMRGDTVYEYTEIGCLTSTDKVRKGTAPKLKTREAKKATNTQSTGGTVAGFVDPGDEELPF